MFSYCENKSSFYNYACYHFLQLKQLTEYTLKYISNDLRFLSLKQAQQKQFDTTTGTLLQIFEVMSAANNLPYSL